MARRKVLRNAFDRRAESGGTWDGGARVAVGRSGGWGDGGWGIKRARESTETMLIQDR